MIRLLHLSLAAIMLALMALTPAAHAVQPDEILQNPVLEQRAREISKVLRCPICQGETIDDSNADISRDLRLYVRERLVEGDSNSEVIDAVTARYGEFVLFQPRLTGINLILWLAGPAMAVIGLLIAFLYVWRRSRASAGESLLSAEEQAQLDRIIARD